jgi:hypothetical protein
VLTRDAEASDHAAASPVGMGGHGALSYPCTVIESVRANSPAAWTYGSGRVTLAVLGLLTLVNEDPAREAGTDPDRRRVALLEAESCRAARRERPDLELLYGHAQQCGRRLTPDVRLGGQTLRVDCSKRPGHVCQRRSSVAQLGRAVLACA